MKFNTTPPSGFTEFSPEQESVRQKWIKIIKNIFEKNGFFSINTPLVERKNNLLAKGGNPKEIYKIARVLDDENSKKDSDMTLRFDHTVPLALYISRNLNNIIFPFKRYSIGPVFRGERAQKGRFRQFDQCDIDIVGSSTLSIFNDINVITIIIEIFQKLNVDDFVVKINNRKILSNFFETLGIKDLLQVKKILDILDNLDKLSEQKIIQNLSEELDNKKIDKIFEFINISKNNKNSEKILSDLKIIAQNNENFEKSIQELETVISTLKNLKIPENFFCIDLSIARGLDYYTGTVFETKFKNYKNFGSVCSGGRYDNLGEIFTGKPFPGVGVSIGLTRILKQAFDEKIIKGEKVTPTDILILVTDEKFMTKSFELANILRQKNFYVENFLDTKKLSKQFEYADKLKIKYVIVLGEKEIKTKKFTIKNMITGEQFSIDESQILDFFLTI